MPVNAVRLQYNRGARSYSVSIPKVIVEMKGWRGSFHPPPEVRAAEPNLPPDHEGTLFLIADDPETGGIKLYPAPTGEPASGPGHGSRPAERETHNP